MVLIESLACGTPVIASRLPGVRTVVDDGVDGFLVNPGDPDDLGDKPGALAGFPACCTPGHGCCRAAKGGGEICLGADRPVTRSALPAGHGGTPGTSCPRSDPPGMIGTMPVYSLAPLEYRLALDAASVWLARSAPLLLRCDQPALQFECLQRLPAGHSPPWRGVLWLEPGHPTWVHRPGRFDCSAPAWCPTGRAAFPNAYPPVAGATYLESGTCSAGALAACAPAAGAE